MSGLRRIAVQQGSDKECGKSSLNEQVFNVDDLLARLALRRPVFHSEADFQHEFAWEARQMWADAFGLQTPLTLSFCRR